MLSPTINLDLNAIDTLDALVQSVGSRDGSRSSPIRGSNEDKSPGKSPGSPGLQLSPEGRMKMDAVKIDLGQMDADAGGGIPSRNQPNPNQGDPTHPNHMRQPAPPPLAISLPIRQPRPLPAHPIQPAAPTSPPPSQNAASRASREASIATAAQSQSTLHVCVRVRPLMSHDRTQKEVTRVLDSRVVIILDPNKVHEKDDILRANRSR